jgi:hypothetical protein
MISWGFQQKNYSQGQLRYDQLLSPGERRLRDCTQTVNALVKYDGFHAPNQSVSLKLVGNYTVSSDYSNRVLVLVTTPTEDSTKNFNTIRNVLHDFPE